MATIDKLMEGKKPGEVLVNQSIWPPREFFSPFFRDRHGVWHGLDERRESVRWSGDVGGWQLYTEPKKKVVKWLWVNSAGYIFSGPNHFLSEKEAAEDLSMEYLGWKKLEWSATEFDE